VRINHNVAAVNAQRNLMATGVSLQKSVERLSSGLRINRASDDAAGLSISEKLRAQIRGLAQAQRNAQDGISLAQTTEGNLDEVHSILQRIRELAVEYKNGSISTAGQNAIQSEVDALSAEIGRIGSQAQFNGVNLLDGSTPVVTLQIGANDGEVLAVSLVDLVGTLGSAYTTMSATNPIAAVDAALDQVSALRSELGAVQNRLDHTLANLAVYHENLTAAESRIRDVDMAEEMVELTKSQILQQAGTAMLAQANQAPQAVLSLLKG
jgi:flagellin